MAARLAGAVVTAQTSRARRLGEDFGEVACRIGPFGERRPAAGKQQHPRRRAGRICGCSRHGSTSPARSGSCWPETVNSTSRVATRWISIRDRMSFQRASWRKASTGMSPSSSRLMRVEQVERELGGDAFGVVVGSDQAVDGLHAVHADQQLRAGAEQARGTGEAGQSRFAGRNCRSSSRGRSRAWAGGRCRREA